MSYDVDILASRKRGMLTIGVTNGIARRAWKVRLIERDNADRDDSPGCGKGVPLLPEMCECSSEIRARGSWRTPRQRGIVADEILA
jgi:hypothetical protein